ncbi:MAG: HAMP domain-containing protein [Deltaproteobacteria bacterium]|nr:HAMP domain-containing protein [Deltaproteobacteria bacterium]
MLRSPPRFRLWMQLAAFAAVGVTLLHGMHLVVADAVTRDALLQAQQARARGMARLVARQAADAVLTHDWASLQDAVVGAASAGEVTYCFAVHDGKVLASSIPGERVAALEAARPAGTALGETLILVEGATRFLDVAEPILDGRRGVVRIGVDLEVLARTSADLAGRLGMVAVLMALVGVLAALLVGRRVARPVGELLDAADAFDAALPPRLLPHRGSDEITELTARFNEMMVRLTDAHREQAAARARAAETERMVALGSLVTGVAHEVNNPLAGLKMCHHRLARADLPPAQHAEYLDLMREALDRIESVVQGLLEFGRPRAPRLQKTAVADVIHQCARLVTPLFHDRGIRLRLIVDGLPDDATVRADGRQLGQGLLNLALNAAYVTTAGGEVRIRARVEDTRFGIAVEDDGPGVPVELRDRIMDPFFSTKPEGQGSGLGLPVTRAIAVAHDGELALSYPAHGGTVAVLWLPRRP